MTKLHVKVGSVWKPLDASNADTLNGMSSASLISHLTFSNQINVIGSHSMLMRNPSAVTLPGAVVASSSLKTTDVSTMVPAGSWRCLGYTYTTGSTLFVRIA